MDLLSYEDQIYLLYYWLRMNIPATATVSSRAALRAIVSEQLAMEYDIGDAPVIDEVVHLFREQAPWDQLPTE